MGRSSTSRFSGASNTRSHYVRSLQAFPPHTHPLTLVSDPDDVLADEDILTALLDRGFTLVDESDPVGLRHRVEQARPWTIDHPLIIIARGPLSELPYDLWQQGHHVTLALHTFFPRLSYPVVRTLTPAQLSRLGRVPVPSRRLGRQATVDFLLRHVFDADPDALRQPASLVAWLDRIHRQPDAVPSLLIQRLLDELQQVAAYAEWPLETLLTEGDAFATWLREQWLVYVQRETGELIRDEPIRYVLAFDQDERLHDTLPGLVRSGRLKPIQVERHSRLPRWARPGVLSPDEDRRPRRGAELLSILVESFPLPEISGPALEDARWEEWQAVARAWAELTTLRYDPDDPLAPAQKEEHDQLQAQIDVAFLDWLRNRYAPLGSRSLPVPHHVHHVPPYIDYHHRQTKAERIAMLVLDGLSLADWLIVAPTWRARHAGWHLDERLLLAQIPTLTAVSRQALVSGLRPADFADTLDTTRVGARRWAAFWARQGLDEEACPHGHLALDRGPPPAEIDSARTRALCLIDTTIDDMVHDATLGTTTFQATLRVWLDSYSRKLEMLIADLLTRGFTVYLTSDHGHVAARGFGRPSEGLTVDTRGTRARIYSDRHAIDNVQQGFARTIRWHDDGLLPGHVWVLMPEGRQAFTTFNKVLVTHGGPTLDEVVVPLVTLMVE